MRVLIDMLRESGSHNMHVLSSSPIVQYGDRYGIAMSTDQLVARDRVSGRPLNMIEIEQALFTGKKGALKARLFFPSVDGFKRVFAEN